MYSTISYRHHGKRLHGAHGSVRPEKKTARLLDNAEKASSGQKSWPPSTDLRQGRRARQKSGFNTGILNEFTVSVIEGTNIRES